MKVLRQAVSLAFFQYIHSAPPTGFHYIHEPHPPLVLFPGLRAFAVLLLRPVP